MRIFARAFIALVTIAALAGCTTIGHVNDQIKQASESRQLDQVCGLAGAAHTLFTVINQQRPFKASTVQREAQAYAVIDRVCTDRPEDIGEALVTALRAYRDIANITKGVDLASN